MPKIFISYRRKSWPFTDRLVDELAKRLETDIFIDRTSIDQADFERAILKHLRASDAVLLVISEYTFEDRIHRDDDWVRREIREALTLQKPLILVCVEGRLPPSGLPDDIKDVARMQGINFYPEYFTPGVDKLAEFIVKIGVAQLRSSPPPYPTPTSTADEKPISGRATLDEALDLLEHGDFNKAAFLFETLRASGYTSRYVKLDELLEQARTEAAQADLRQRAQQDYEEIAALAARTITLDRARAAFDLWRSEFPTLVEALDSANLRGRFQPVPRIHLSAAAVRAVIHEPFEWCDVPAGDYLYGDNKQKLTLPAFAIAKYPITYKQFQSFIDANDGFRDARWWEGLAQDQSAAPDEQEWKIDAHPRENVSWYDATAFCRWLSWRLGGEYALDKLSAWAVRLPTEFEWEKAARGTQGLAYPYSDTFDQSRSNTSEAGIGKTTPVTQYLNGASPYGVLDMSGNVWEWCLTDYNQPAPDAASENISSYARRVVRGGSWINNRDSARAAYRDSSPPLNRGFHLGFRCVRPPSL